MTRIKIMEQIDRAIENEKLNVDTIDFYRIVSLVYEYNNILEDLYYANMEYFDELLEGTTPSQLLQWIEDGNASWYDDYFKITYDNTLETLTEMEYMRLLEENAVEILYELIINNDVWNELIDNIGWYMSESDFITLNNIKNSVDN